MGEVSDFGIDRPTLAVAASGAVLTITLSRPETFNAISAQLLADLNWALDQVDELRPQPRCVLLTGSGKAFCAGGDISVHVDRPPGAEPYDLGDVLHRLFNPMLLRLLRLPVPLVMAVNGAAAGAGCPLALCGDVVVAAQSAYFECGFARIGLMPDLGATWLLPRLIGRARAHAMMMLDQRITAATAEAWGMIHACVADEDLAKAATDMARKLCDGATDALVATRKSTLAASSQSLAEALEAEAETQRVLGYSPDFAEGIAAFFARRRPRFGTSGR